MNKLRMKGLYGNGRQVRTNELRFNIRILELMPIAGHKAIIVGWVPEFTAIRGVNVSNGTYNPQSRL